MGREDLVANRKGRQALIDNLSISSIDCEVGGAAPPVIVATLSLLQEMQEDGETRIIVVVPDREQFGFITTLLLAVDSAIGDNSPNTYNPSEFSKGQLLKCGKCIVEFDSVDLEKGTIKVLCAPAPRATSASAYTLPLSIAPFFQKTDTVRPLSKLERVRFVRHEIEHEHLSTQRLMEDLSNLRTHISGTIAYVATLNQAVDLYTELRLEGKALQEALLFAKIRNQGEVTILNSGKLSGEPSIAFASNLFSVCQAMENGLNIKTLVIDTENLELVVKNDLNLIDDELGRSKVPVIIITDTASSFELNELQARGFKVWRWDAGSLSAVQADYAEGIFSGLSRKLLNCVQTVYSYEICQNDVLDRIYRGLSQMHVGIKDTGTGADLEEIYDNLWQIYIDMIRCVQDGSIVRAKYPKERFYNWLKMVSEQQGFAAPDVLRLMCDTIGETAEVVMHDGFRTKADVLERVILSKSAATPITILVPNNEDIPLLTTYWKKRLGGKRQEDTIQFMSCHTFLTTESAVSEEVIVCGWFGSGAMRKICFSYLASTYTFILYNSESQWKNSHTKRWSQALSVSNTAELARRVFKVEIGEHLLPAYDMRTETTVEIDEVESYIRENIYRKYQRHDGPADEIVDCIPTAFAGGAVAFWGMGKKLISATSIILGKDQRIRELRPDELSVGDFVAVREAEKDLIVQIADAILQSRNQENSRQTASLWKQTLTIERIVRSDDEIFAVLQQNGFKLGMQTLRNWLYNDAIIAPHSKDDLLCLATALNDEVLIARVDEIWETAQIVRSAHIEAGVTLSKRLSKHIPEALSETGITDPFEIWDEIPLRIDDVGTVRLLKVVDIGEKSTMPKNKTNRVFRE